MYLPQLDYCTRETSGYLVYVLLCLFEVNKQRNHAKKCHHGQGLGLLGSPHFLKGALQAKFSRLGTVGAIWLYLGTLNMTDGSKTTFNANHGGYGGEQIDRGSTVKDTII